MGAFTLSDHSRAHYPLLAYRPDVEVTKVRRTMYELLNSLVQKIGKSEYVCIWVCIWVKGVFRGQEFLLREEMVGRCINFTP